MKHSGVWKGKHVGRYHGEKNRKHLPKSHLEPFACSPVEAAVLERTARGIITARAERQEAAAQARGARGGSRWWEREGSWTAFVNVPELLRRLPELVAAKPPRPLDRREARPMQGLPWPLAGDDLRKRMFPGPCGLSTIAFQAGTASECLTTQPTPDSAAPGKGAGSTCLPGADGGTPLGVRGSLGVQTWEDMHMLRVGDLWERRRGLVARESGKSAMRVAWALYDRENVKREQLEASANPIGQDGHAKPLAFRRAKR